MVPFCSWRSRCRRWQLQYTTPSNNAFITAANVVIVPFLWWAISKKKPGAKFIVSSFLCLLGIGILSINFSEGFAFKIGDLMTLAAPFCSPARL